MALTLAAPSVTHAEPAKPTAVELDRAAELFKKAKALHGSGKLDQARDLYTQAWTLHRSPDIAANLAACELALNKYRDAAEHFDFALRHLLAGTTQDQKARLTEGFEKAKKEIATVRLDVQPAGASVVIDGTTIGTSPIADDTFVEAGERKIRVTKAGHETYVGSFTVAKGESKTVRVALEANAAAGPAGTARPASTPPPGGNGSKSGPTGAAADTGGKPQSAVPAYIALGAGIVGLGAGIGFLVAASGKESDKDALLDEIPGTNKCGPGTIAAEKCAEVTSLSDDAKQFRTFGYVGFGVAAAGGVLTFLLWPRSSDSSSGTMIVPSVTARGTSLHLQGRF
ncbi:MAG: PEGA domain-containing protein [Polyangiaceae bacterium]|nr:PEGA domain-containing protein [Polyangiaceae bacterium]